MLAIPSLIRHAALVCALATARAATAQQNLPVAPGPFTGTAQSLQKYRAPDWFRDAKFGIWSHWGPQAVPRQGDWYARKMYIPGDRHYKHHLETYGHPSKHGFKDIIPLWKAEKWNPNALMALYARAGAKYFVSMGVHHDNFDLWNSRFHAWNAVSMGPRRDVVGEWKRAAQKFGLRFGVSEHLGASYSWFQTSHGADTSGPLAGVPYDGADPKWQALYHSPSSNGPGWYTNSPEAQRNWYCRIQNLIDEYQPDLLYSDGGIPFGEVGHSLIAHLYNSSIQRHGGKLEAVYNYKGIGSGQAIEGAGVLDVERGGLARISALPWQTDTSIGDWFYSEGFRYKTARQVIHQMADIVSKNGNLLINVVQYPDGSLPPESLQFLREMAQWMPLNGEAIYGTRPWTIFGEGPTQVRAGNFREDFPFTAHDIRFTTKKDALYAITLGAPSEPVLIKSLALGSPLVTGSASNVSLLGHKGKLQWARTAQGLEIQLPKALPSQHALAFKILGFKTVANVDPALIMATVSQTIEPGADGSITLLPDQASLHGGGIGVEGEGEGANIGFWDNARDWVSWDKVKLAPGAYRVALDAATIHNSSDFVLEVAGRKLPGKATLTGSWNAFKTFDLGTVEIGQAGTFAVSVRPSVGAWNAINIRAIRLSKVTQ